MQKMRVSGVQRVFVKKISWIWFFLTLLTIAVYTALGPAEHSLGTHIRLVYLHAAWVWTSLACFLAAGVLGGFGLITKRGNIHRWSQAFGRTGLIFWVSYLPLSLLAMQSNWNGLYLAEPRWRLALVFSITGILLQTGLSLAARPGMTSAINLGFWIALMIALAQTPNVMHPTSPILSSDAWRIRIYFFGLVLLTLLASIQIARWWYKGEPNLIQR